MCPTDSLLPGADTIGNNHLFLKEGENEDRNEDWKDTDDSGGIFDAFFLISFSRRQR